MAGRVEQTYQSGAGSAPGMYARVGSYKCGCGCGGGGGGGGGGDGGPTHQRIHSAYSFQSHTHPNPLAQVDYPDLQEALPPLEVIESWSQVVIQTRHTATDAPINHG